MMQKTIKNPPSLSQVNISEQLMAPTALYYTCNTT